MESFFGTAWDGLSLSDIESFLDGEEDEGMTWETKGTERPSRHDVRKAVSGLANQQGGFLIVGARREGRRWVVDGVDFGGEEPKVWISNVIAGGLDPVPRFDVNAWAVADGRHVGVVNVEQGAVPPCVTSAGQVYERLPGKTEPVTASRLAALFERGETRTAAAEADALKAATDYSRRAVTFPEPPYLCLTLAMSPTGKVEDVGGRLFTPTFEATLNEVFEGLPGEPLFPYPSHADFHTSISQDARTAVANNETNRQRWFVRAAWDASVAVSLDLNPKPEDAARLLADAVFDEAVRPAADAASTLVTALGGYGKCHAVLNVEAHSFTLGDGQAGYGEIGVVRPIQVWTDAEGRLSEQVLAKMKREVLRACRLTAYEPEQPEAVAHGQNEGSALGSTQSE